MLEKNTSRLITPDGRYIVVRGRLLRTPDPNISPEARNELEIQLASLRRDLSKAKRQGDLAGQQAVLNNIEEIKFELGELGPVWWNDGEPDYDRKIVKNSPYLPWYEEILSKNG